MDVNLWYSRFSENENEAVEAHIPRIEIPRPKNRDIEKRRQLTHTSCFQDIFLEDKKPRRRDSKAKKPRHRVSAEF